MPNNITLRFAAISIVAMLVAWSANAAIDLGAVAHDVVCPDHGILFS
jgi:hypothetical protein